ncbi:MAG: Sensor protein SphS [Chroococcidiopsis cubana SAG 39.79]|uniref:histidine kinase n=1 Tax=Chroococcidiopsis cubana SAG 39.79 TaxID=388085 RepID=A0AB37UR46_9CYAN|nr:HAMP domain-containing sensor histidine kinase [Chroococcidiopsis cubana]MDZ4874256.1 Sensor protein SphS [Chroococcidiopsis cubana SAG 39.79]PSB64909.1 histidine kinase [Chroococcidiopsis cubana CCALA 043]RUT13853.1 PAS domain-containing sensor histidine kinase [Chroococcidiopsis cubana SAG 39.79]
MVLLAFLLGLGIGICLWLWQYTQLQARLRRLLRTVSNDSEMATSLGAIPRLRHEIVSARQQREELQAKLQTWEQLMQVAPVGYLQVDEENQLLWCNQQAQQLLGLQKWEPGQVRLLLEWVRSYELDQLIEQTRERQQPQVKEWLFHRTSADAAALSELRALTVNAATLPLQNGQVGVFLENRQPLLDLARTRDRWVSDLAHELKTPLTSILLVVENLQQQLEPPYKLWVDRLLPEVERLISLVQNWLELSQLELDPSRQLKREPVELRSLIDSVCHTIEPLTQRQQLRLSYSGAETLWIEADKSRLTQVLLNLLDNSIKYSPFQSTIWVNVELINSETKSNYVQINIIDSGCGFPATDLPYVFERLYRGDLARARQTTPDSKKISPFTTHGSGLGLAIVKQIVSAHGGTVKAMNHPETKGAWLQIELPTQ